MKSSSPSSFFHGLCQNRCDHLDIEASSHMLWSYTDISSEDLIKLHIKRVGHWDIAWVVICLYSCLSALVFVLFSMVEWLWLWNPFKDISSPVSWWLLHLLHLLILPNGQKIKSIPLTTRNTSATIALVLSRHLCSCIQQLKMKHLRITVCIHPWKTGKESNKGVITEGPTWTTMTSLQYVDSVLLQLKHIQF